MRRRYWLTVLLGVLLGVARPAAAQLTILHSHQRDPGYPTSPLVSDGAGTLYGTEWYGGSVYMLKTDGTGFRVLRTFANDGVGGIVLDGVGNLYGATGAGGAARKGTVFTMRVDGSGYRVLHEFSGAAADAATPRSALALDSGTLYGFADGGSLGYGAIYSLRTDGTGYTVLHSFDADVGGSTRGYSGPVLDGAGNIFGTPYGDSPGSFIFRIATDGTGYTILRRFDTAWCSVSFYEAGRLYGSIGSVGAGTFRIRTDGSDYAILGPAAAIASDRAGHLFGTDGSRVFVMRTDGSGLTTLRLSAGWGSITESAGTLFGTLAGSQSDPGALHSMKANGTDYREIHRFLGVYGDGSNPTSGLVADAAGNLYGTVRDTWGPPWRDSNPNTYFPAGAVFKLAPDGSNYAVLHNFYFDMLGITSPRGPLALDGAGYLYGVGSNVGYTAVFRMKTDGSDYTVLKAFRDRFLIGSFPRSGVVLGSAGNLYGVAGGGSSGYDKGVVYTVRTDGTGARVLHHFRGGAADGESPGDGVVIGPGGKLFGAALGGGSSGRGVVFSMNPDGTEFTILHAFSGPDGYLPFELAIDSDGYLYGGTAYGGASNSGVVFRLRTDGAGFEILHAFSGTDGWYVRGGVVLDPRGWVHGTTNGGGANGVGVVFSMRKNGSGFTVRHSFGRIPDGAAPTARLLLDDQGNLFGTTTAGGTVGLGTEFRLGPLPPDFPLTIPIVLSTRGANGSFFTSELAFTNRASTDASLKYTYTSAFGGANGTASDLLAGGTQKIVPDAIEYLQTLGIPVGTSGDRGGTLRIDTSASGVAATVRTTTPVPGGRVGLAYLGVPASRALTAPVVLCGLRQNDSDRSNVAVVNAGAVLDGPITLRLTVVSGDPARPQTRALPDIVLDPGGFRQIPAVLSSGDLALTNGYVKVERVSGIASFLAYGVINDNPSSDGSFIEPVLADPPAPVGRLTLPILVETNAYSSELIVTNIGASPRTLHGTWVASALSGGEASFDLSLLPNEQQILPAFVQVLRDRGVVHDPAGPAFAGAVFFTDATGDLRGISVGVRTTTPGVNGRYGVFAPAVPAGVEATTSAWLYDLRQDAENRTNLALVNAGSTDSSADTFRIELFDGATGIVSGTVEDVTVPARGFVQVDAILARYAPGVSNGYASVTRTSGNNPFIAYAVINDGAKPGERSGDGSFVQADLP